MSSNLPPAAAEAERRRERAAVALATKGDFAAVLKLLDAWRETGATPGPGARVAEARALLHFRMVDAALGKAREVVESNPSDRVALRALAEAYIERGWPLRARPILEGLRSAGESVEELMARAGAEPPRPEALAREIEPTGGAPELLRLAELFLATGSRTRANALLDRVAGLEPANPRVAELRWAMAANYRSKEPLELQVKRALPAILELAAVPEDSEHTESLSKDGGVLLEPEVGGATFPTLFKRTGAGPEPAPDDGDDEEERTASSAVSDAAPSGLRALTNANPADTQILMVVGEGESSGAMHKRRDEPGKVLNLREWQASMGVDPMASDLDGVDLSEELNGRADAAPVVETVAPSEAPPEPMEVASGPIEVVELHPTPPPLEEVEVEAVPAAASGVSSGLVRALLGVVFLAAFGVLLLVLAALIARATGLLDGARASVDLGRTLASSDYPALLEAEARLDEHARDPSERAELAYARTVVWAEYDGNPSRLREVDAFLAAPDGLDSHRLAYLRAAQLLGFRNPASALAAIGRQPPMDDEQRLLLARIHAELGDAEAAAADLAGIVAQNEPRYRVGRAEVLLTLGKRDEARGVITLLVSEHPHLTAARLLELQLVEGGAKQRASAAEAFRTKYRGLGLAPRQESEAAWVETSAWLEAGQRERAIEAAKGGLARDGTHRDLGLLLATDDVQNSELLDAARKLTTLHELYRADPEVRRNLVLVSLELDRVELAAELAEAANPPQREQLIAVVAGWSAAAGAPDTNSVDAATPLGAYAQAWLAAHARRQDAASLAARAAELLAASPDPWLSRLAKRTEILSASLLPEPEATQRISKLANSGLADAAAHLLVGRHYERAGSRLLAAQHFDRAADLEPELGLALYEKARFYADASDPEARTRSAWHDYLSLAPTGPRAERARSAFGG